METVSCQDENVSSEFMLKVTFIYGENLSKSYCRSVLFLQMYFDWRLSCLGNNSRPYADTAAYLPGLQNRVSATDPPTVLFFESEASMSDFFLPLPSNSCVLHLLDCAKQFKI